MDLNNNGVPDDVEDALADLGIGVAEDYNNSDKSEEKDDFDKQFEND